MQKHHTQIQRLNALKDFLNFQFVELNAKYVAGPLNLLYVRRILTIVKKRSQGHQKQSMLEDANIIFNISPLMAKFNNSQLKEFCSERDSALIHPSLYRTVKLN